MTPKDALEKEKTRRIAIAPVCMVLNLALEHVPEDFILARLAHKQLTKWVSGGKFDAVLNMRPTLHDEVVRSQKRFSSWDKKPDVDDDGNQKPRGPLYTFATLRSLENAITAGLNGDEGDLAEAIDDLDDIPIDPPEEEEGKKKAAKKSRGRMKVVGGKSGETLADLVRSLGEVLSVRPQPKGQSKAS